MGIILILFATVALSVWTAEKEEELEREMAKRYCPFCGAELLEEDVVCVVCGTPASKGTNIYALDTGVGVEEVTEEEEIQADWCDKCELQDECGDYRSGCSCAFGDEDC